MGYDRKLNIFDLKRDPDFYIAVDESTQIRPLSVSDITEDYIDGLNDSEVNQFLVGPRSEYQSLESVTAFVLGNFNDPQAILFGYFINGILSATCRLHDITERSAFLGLAIFKKTEWGKGHGTKILSSVLNFAFSYLELETISAGIEKKNIASEKVFLKNGFSPCTDNGESRFWEKKRPE